LFNRYSDPEQEVQDVVDVLQVLHVALKNEHCPLIKNPVEHERQFANQTR